MWIVCHLFLLGLCFNLQCFKWVCWWVEKKLPHNYQINCQLSLVYRYILPGILVLWLKPPYNWITIQTPHGWPSVVFYLQTKLNKNKWPPNSSRDKWNPLSPESFLLSVSPMFTAFGRHNLFLKNALRSPFVFIIVFYQMRSRPWLLYYSIRPESVSHSLQIPACHLVTGLLPWLKSRGMRCDAWRLRMKIPTVPELPALNVNYYKLPLQVVQSDS